MQDNIARTALSVLALTVAATLVLGCSKDPRASSTRGLSGATSASSSAQDGQSDSSASLSGSNASVNVVGVLHYSGAINGTVRFHSSDCVVVEHGLLPGPPFQGLNAPDQNSPASGHPPLLGVVPYGGRWHIMFNPPPSATQNWRKKLLSAVVEHGVRAIHHGDKWKVVLHQVRLGDLEFVASNNKKQGFVLLNGQVTCQRMD